mmetsp:Transcript_21619/g.38625  ORF Transcript_21619/g.38625 Transcript_21619/m.38625 type:complete len:210 (-) Transcript_21619:2040-2669(-)
MDGSTFAVVVLVAAAEEVVAAVFLSLILLLFFLLFLFLSLLLLLLLLLLLFLLLLPLLLQLFALSQTPSSPLSPSPDGLTYDAGSSKSSRNWILGLPPSPRRRFHKHTLSTSPPPAPPGANATATACAASSTARISFSLDLGIFGASVPCFKNSTSSSTSPASMHGSCRRTIKMAASFIKLANAAADQSRVRRAAATRTVSSFKDLFRE